MRGPVLVLGALAACGRIGFDSACAVLDPSCPALPRFVDVQLGARSVCALDDIGDIYCWGSNDVGQLGLGEAIAASDRPQRIDDAMGPFAAMSVGSDHACGLRGGVAWCWGRNNFGEVTGVGSVAIARPTPIAAPIAFDAIAAGGRYTCALGDGQLWCWGASDFNGLGMDVTGPTRVGALDDWQTLSAGTSHACALSASQGVVCWGDNGHGAVNPPGTGAPGSRDLPTSVALPSLARSLVAGTADSCAILEDGSLWCWGFNNVAQIDASGVDVPAPTRIGSDVPWTGVADSVWLNCGIHGGVARCWGWAQIGGFGDGFWSRFAIPYDQGIDLGSVDQIAVSTGSYDGPTYETTCIRVAGRVSCFGDNSVGQLGIGMHTYEPAAIEIAPPLGHVWQHIASGRHHACATIEDGSLYCWGANELGQVDVTDVRGAVLPCTSSPCDRPVPQRAPVATVREVVAGQEYTCARNDATITCWGDTTFGVRGANNAVAGGPPSLPAPPSGAWVGPLIGGDEASCGTPSASSMPACWGDMGQGWQALPIFVAGAEAHDLVSAGFGRNYGCAVRGTDRARVCWGVNDAGQLGDGTTTDNPTPVAFDIGGYVAIAAAGGHSCGVTTGGNVTCWGGSDAGQSGLQTGIATSPNTVMSAGGPLSGCTSIDVTPDVSCAACGGQLWCWGYHVLGVDPMAPQYLAAPVSVPPGHDFVEVALGDERGCALDDLHALFCWGNGRRGELGNASYAVNVPVPIGR